MKDLWLLILGILGLILAWFLCLGGAKPIPTATIVPPIAATAPVIAAPASPAAASWLLGADGKVVLDGTVRDQAVRDSLVAHAKSVYGDANVTDKLKIDGGLGDLKSVVLRGDVASQKIKDDTGEATKKRVGPDVAVDNQLRVAAAQVQQAQLKSFLTGKTIEFATGSAVITDNGIKILNQVVPLVQSEVSTKIRVEGHTDNVGDPASNKGLSQQRARATMAYLISRGVAADRLASTGFGDEKPIANNNTVEGRQHNRRIEFVVEEK
jgi:OmpA-OmpF porin, OOP family